MGLLQILLLWIGCKIYSGPFVYNFNEVYQFLIKNNIAKKIKSVDHLAILIIKDLKNRAKKNSIKLKQIDKYGSEIYKQTIHVLEKVIWYENTQTKILGWRKIKFLCFNFTARLFCAADINNNQKFFYKS